MNPRFVALALILLPPLSASVAASQDPPPDAVPEQDPGEDPNAEDSKPQDSAAEPSAQAADSPDAHMGRPPLELTIEDALRLGASNNIDTKIDEIATEVAAFNARGSWGAFEWVFDGSVTYIDAERDGGSQISDSAETETGALSLDLNKALTTSGSVSFSYDTRTDDTTSSLADATKQTSDVLTLAYVQPLRRGFGREYATSDQREAELVWFRQREVQRQGWQAMEFGVYNAYWDLVDAIQLRGVADSALELGLEQLTQNRRRLDAGVGTEVEVLQAQSDVAGRIESLLLAQTTVDTAMDGLKMLLFSSKDEDLWELELVPTTPLPDDPTIAGTPGWGEALLTALDMRSELRQQRTDIDIARLNHKRTLSERLSGVELQLSASTGAIDEDRGGAFEDTATFEYPTYSALLAYNMPIGNKTADYAERAARANVRAALLTYDNIELGVLTEVRQAVRDVEYQVEAVRAAVESLRLERRQLEAEQARFDEGLSTLFEVLEFQQDMIEAMVRERTARVNYSKSLVALRNAQGLLGEERN